MKLKAILLLFCICGLGRAQTSSTAGCPSQLTIEIIELSGQSVYRLQQKNYPKYPLDVVGRISSHCSKVKKINIVVNSGARFDDVITAVNGAGKDQIDQVFIYLKARNGLLYPVTLGEKSVSIEQ